jgi:hypothetical protein
LAGGIIAEAAGLRAPFIIGGILRGAIFLALLPALLAAASPPGEGSPRLGTVSRLSGR